VQKSMGAYISSRGINRLMMMSNTTLTCSGEARPQSRFVVIAPCRTSAVNE
jgi:hypothetical protein